MKSLRFKLSAFLRPVRLLLAICVCTLLVFSQVLPAYAQGKPLGFGRTDNAPSSTTGGEANLTKIEEKSQEAVLDKPYSLKETQKEAQKGLNEIQGAADADKMKRPSNTKGVESIEDKVRENLEKATGKD